jgi:hypothetical protein
MLIAYKKKIEEMMTYDTSEGLFTLYMHCDFFLKKRELD